LAGDVRVGAIVEGEVDGQDQAVEGEEQTAVELFQRVERGQS
jgi:hypothetical protein